MKKYFYILSALFLTVTLGACSKDKEHCDPDDEESPCYVGLAVGDKLLLTEEKTNGKSEMRFEYNDQNKVIVRYVHGVDGSVATENFTYSGDHATKVERRSDGQLVMSEEYYYGSGDKPTTGVLKDNKGEIIANVIYAYSEQTVTETSFNMEGEQIGSHTYTFDSSGKNIIKTVIRIQNLPLSTLEYGDYDDKPCRYTNYPWMWKLGSMNNARSHSLITGSSVTRNDRWEYTYNQAGYPIKAEVYDRATDELLETRVFTYKKAN